MQATDFNPIRILSLDGSEIYRAMHRVDGAAGLTVRGKDGKLNVDRFGGFLDISLDTDRMQKVYASHKELPGKFRVCKEYTTAVVNVSFDFAVKEFYNVGQRLFVRDGYSFDRDLLKDHVIIKEADGVSTLIAIEVLDDTKETDTRYAAVENPISCSLLDPYFYYDYEARAYRVVRKADANGVRKPETLIPVKKNRREIRRCLYQNGFDVDGIHYVRYKRSAGSSREGHCLFIAEPLYEDMMKWSECGINAESVKDRASLQSYIALTLSSIEKRIHIPRQSILLLRDEVSAFKETVIKVEACEKALTAEKKEAEISNVIWDGEALLDVSVFEENGYADKGMMLLRNRFFKTCAFNTNLQKWFEDNGVTRLTQLNGIYSKKARSIKDIKLVITESSLKYLKFKPSAKPLDEWFETWLDNVFTDKDSSLFGVVKTDKATGPMGNKMARTNYQLINTLELSRSDTDALLSQSFDFLHLMQRDSAFVRYYNGLFAADEFDGEDNSTIENYRQRLISDLLRRSDRFDGTPFYKNYRSDLTKSFKERLKRGRVLIEGGYHTLLGNGIEFLHAVIDKNYRPDSPIALCDGEIYAPRFDDGETLLCERSPHITMGNLFVAKNKRVPDIDKYFNLGSAMSIVCVNAIGSNLQQRLNGCDYDSDTMLITNNPVLRDAAIRNYGRFPVPFCAVSAGGSISYTTSPEDLAALDIKIAENKIGQIVNLSQFLNSLYWDGFSSKTDEESEALYADICKLAVLSGMEIDKAKRLYDVSADAVLAELSLYQKRYKDEHEGTLPEFFTFITESENTGGESEDSILNTAMSFVYDAVKSHGVRAPRSQPVSYAELFDLEYTKGDKTGAFGKRRDSILGFVQEAHTKISHLNYISKKKKRSERILALREADELFEACKERIGKSADDHVYSLLLKELDNGSTSFHSLLFAAMCYTADGYLLKKLKKPECEMTDVIPFEGDSSSGDLIWIYGHPHVRGRKNQS